MPEACKFNIGDISIGLIPDMLEGFFDTPGSFDNFRAQGPADITLNIHFDQVPDVPVEEMIFDSGSGWRQYCSQARFVLWVRSSQRDPRLVGVFSKDFHSGDIFVGASEIDPGRFIFPLSYPLGELYMTNLLGTGFGVIFHSCGVIYQGFGLLFAGIGGAGKSTTAHLWQHQSGARVINDDRVMIRKTGGQFRMYGTPWHGLGGMSLAEDAPLKRIFILKHANSNQVLPLSPSQAVSALLARSFSPFWSTQGLNFTLQFLADLCQEVPCAELGFIPDNSAVDFVCNL